MFNVDHRETSKPNNLAEMVKTTWFITTRRALFSHGGPSQNKRHVPASLIANNNATGKVCAFVVRTLHRQIFSRQGPII